MPDAPKSDLARLDRMKDENIDYSDIPPLDNSFLTKPTAAPPDWPYFGGEDELSALLLATVIQHCAAQPTVDDLDSHGLAANADAMVALEEQGLIEISHQDGLHTCGQR